MRRVVAVGLMFLSALPACRDEPSFDERYDAAQKKIRVSADRIDRDLEAAPTPAGSSPPEGRVEIED
ncbi:hypothetical protein [Erythrobacter neustonensis]|uniref:hypothetical protein n=1 Tax=Erythrobacter neustonensis TaxID=1112 RepID=UPI000B18FCA0|nr:hypothetical protein [Erythrobacter neustonensis]